MMKRKETEHIEKNGRVNGSLNGKSVESVPSVKIRDADKWEVRKLGEVCILERGHNPPKSKFIHQPKEGYVRFYQIRDGASDAYETYVPDSPQLHKVEPQDILMVAYRHIGKVFRGVKGAFNVALCKITNARRDILHDDFLFYMIPTDIIKGELIKRSERSLIPSMSVEHLKEINIPLPPLPEQQRIVSILDETFAAIEQAKANVERNLQNAKELFESELNAIFSNKGEDWEEKRLGDIAKVIGGYSFKSGDFQSSGKYQVLRMGNVRPGVIRISESPVFINEIDDNTLQKADSGMDTSGRS